MKSAIYIDKDKLLKRLGDHMTTTSETVAQYIKSVE